MGLLEEYVVARVNAADDARRMAEREVLRQRRERVVVVRWREALLARRTVRSARIGARRSAAPGSAAGAAEPVAEPAAGPVRDLARSVR
ncbi:hypothetical protein IT072_14410 [Leifsonia sp. ZF2019]|uniref:hypothetical protein n=1 Tax=unclassified Leifsonia TaxID=2663824 RepID=UPI001CBF2680|nr:MULTISPECIES: hypothetical protein [unclassified Leifsonia]UAJ78446.1 hypothetical protein IT072_14410 [Leifsonia sp. ZF2019]